MKAVVDFVNNDEECRSVQLLRYFNEKSKKTCGNCDVCRKKGSDSVPYNSIEERLESVVSESPLSMEKVVSQCKEFEETKVLDAIRFLVDNGVFQLEGNGALKRKGNKKSRHS